MRFDFVLFYFCYVSTVDDWIYMHDECFKNFIIYGSYVNYICHMFKVLTGNRRSRTLRRGLMTCQSKTCQWTVGLWRPSCTCRTVTSYLSSLPFTRQQLTRLIPCSTIWIYLTRYVSFQIHVMFTITYMYMLS